MLGDGFSFPQHLRRTMKRTPTDSSSSWSLLCTTHPALDWEQHPPGSQGKAECTTQPRPQVGAHWPPRAGRAFPVTLLGHDWAPAPPYSTWTFADTSFTTRGTGSLWGAFSPSPVNVLIHRLRQVTLSTLIKDNIMLHKLFFCFSKEQARFISYYVYPLPHWAALLLVLLGLS